MAQLFQMSVLVAIDEAETLDGPVQTAFTQQLLGSGLAGRIGLFRIGGIGLAARARGVGVIDVGLARQNETRFGRMHLCRVDEVARAFEVAPPYQVCVRWSGKPRRDG